MSGSIQTRSPFHCLSSSSSRLRHPRFSGNKMRTPCIINIRNRITWLDYIWFITGLMKISALRGWNFYSLMSLHRLAEFFFITGGSKQTLLLVSTTAQTSGLYRIIKIYYSWILLYLFICVSNNIISKSWATFRQPNAGLILNQY